MTVLLYALLILASYFASAWVWMLLVGVVHHAWWPAVPTLSYSGSLQITVVLALMGLLVGVAKGIAGAER